VPPGPTTLEPRFTAKSTLNLEAKRRIGQAAAAMVRPGDSLALSAGTTTLALAQALTELEHFPTLTVAEHLRMVCFGHGVVEADERVSDLLEDLELRRLAGHLPEELSSGQRRRLALASVLARPRRLLVLDEPEQRLDRVTRLLLADMLVEEREAGGGVLMVSHDPEIVEEAATDVLLVGRDTRMLSVDDGVRAIEEGLR